MPVERVGFRRVRYLRPQVGVPQWLTVGDVISDDVVRDVAGEKQLAGSSP